VVAPRRVMAPTRVMPPTLGDPDFRSRNSFRGILAQKW
jgi:hypothetical protein